jgi:peroxiredoxin
MDMKRIAVWSFLTMMVALLPAAAMSGEVAASAEEIRPLLIGSSVPDVQVQTIDGKQVSLPKALGDAPVVVVFYRAGWCPFCSRQLGGLRDIEAPLKEMGVSLIAISGDTPERLQKSQEEVEVTYTLLSDYELHASKAFGLAFHVSDEYVTKLSGYKLDIAGSSVQSQQILPVPAVFVVGADKVITFSYVNPNYRVRCDPDVILAAAKAAAQTGDAP